MTDTTRTDVLIIGGGPAGLSAAVWCSDLGLSSILIEREPDIGGQLKSIYGPIGNYMGLRTDNGGEMLDHFRATTDGFGFTRLINTEVARIELSPASVILSNDRSISYEALIIATGVRRRRLGVPGEDEFRGKGVIESGVRDRDLAAGKRVVIVGGGDAAIENALMLADSGSSVTVVHRRKEFRARSEFLDKLNGRDDIELVRDAAVKKIIGDTTVSSVQLENLVTGESHEVPADMVLIRIGVDPNSEFARGILDLDEDGYIKVDASGETSVPGVFAIGDVANPRSPTISTACGTGATAARCAHLFIRDKSNGL